MTKTILSAVFALLIPSIVVADEVKPDVIPSPAASSEVKLLAVGDVMLSRHIGKVIASKGDKFPFDAMRSTLMDGDIVFGNLESVLGDSADTAMFPEKPFNFIAPLAMARTLRETGFTVMSLANNHAMDYGEGALSKTRKELAAEGIKSFGTGEDIKEARAPAVVDVKGFKFAFLGYGVGHSSKIYATTKRPGVAPLVSSEIIKDVKGAREKADVVIVSLHWGMEYSSTPDEKQREIAHRIIDAGADVILGHHPHVMQGIEFYKGKPIAYSLGNFLFDQKGNGTDRSVVLALGFNGGALKSASIVPLDRFLSFYPKPAEGEVKKEMLDDLKRISEPLNDGDGFERKLGLE